MTLLLGQPSLHFWYNTFDLHFSIITNKVSNATRRLIHSSEMKLSAVILLATAMLCVLLGGFIVPSQALSADKTGKSKFVLNIFI